MHVIIRATLDGIVAGEHSKRDGIVAGEHSKLGRKSSKYHRNLAARKFCAAIKKRKECKNAANKDTCSWIHHKKKCKGKRKACASLASKKKCHKSKYHNFCKWSYKKTKCRKVKCKEIDAKRDCKPSRRTSKKGCEWKNKQCRKKRSVADAGAPDGRPHDQPDGRPHGRADLGSHDQPDGRPHGRADLGSHDQPDGRPHGAPTSAPTTSPTAAPTTSPTPAPSVSPTPAPWIQRGDDIDGEAADDWSGYSVSLSADGTTLAVGAVYNDGGGGDAGHARVFAWDPSTRLFAWDPSADETWKQRGDDIDGEAASDWSGASVSLSADGTALAVGAHYNDGASSYAATRVCGDPRETWKQRGDDIDGEAAYDYRATRCR
ncbi:hypothetical protein SO694_00143019 [Aureococcus anophagefferens]|uniref:Anaphase-promoting complex subunit 4 WD40 domain-containing protein n=1 Tax=Aureococcus anophagefferens TaxID=44056 RepID=A0ABR1FPI8_AURAN